MSTRGKRKMAAESLRKSVNTAFTKRIQERQLAKEAKETQPMSDTLPEQEDAILTTIRNSDDAQRKQIQESDWCDDCHGYTHMPWCPSYDGLGAGERSILKKPHAHDFKQVEGQSSLECACGAVPDYDEHQPAARGGGESDPWKAVHRIKLKHEKVVEAAKLLLAMNNCNYDRDQMRRSGGFDALQEAVEAIDPNWTKKGVLIIREKGPSA